jgi:hypothetical protein
VSWLVLVGAGCHGRGLGKPGSDGAAGAAVPDASGESSAVVDAVATVGVDGAASDGLATIEVDGAVGDGLATAGADGASVADSALDVGGEVGSDGPASPPYVPVHQGTVTTSPTKDTGFPTYQDPSAIAFGGDGALYLAGAFSGPTDFDPGPAADVRSPTGTVDVYLTKLAADGHRVWTLTWGGQGDSYLHVGAIAVGANAIAVGGTYTHEVDLDPGPGVLAGASDALASTGGFVSRFSLDGKLVWASSFLGAEPRAVSLDAAGAVYAAGGFRGPCDFDPGPGRDERGTLGGNEGGFLVKLSAADGGLGWARTWDGSYCEGHINGVAVAASGDAWVTGTTAEGTACIFGDAAIPGDSAKGGFIAFFSSAGQRKGAWKVGHIAPQAIAATSDGTIFVGGDGVGSVDFDRGPGVATRELLEVDHFPTGFVLGLASDGAFRWVQTRTSASIRGLAPLATGGVLALGAPSPALRPTQGSLVERLDAAGATTWSFRVGSDADLHAQAIAAGPASFAICGGAFDSDDLDPGAATDVVAARTTFFVRYAL